MDDDSYSLKNRDNVWWHSNALQYSSWILCIGSGWDLGWLRWVALMKGSHNLRPNQFTLMIHHHSSTSTLPKYQQQHQQQFWQRQWNLIICCNPSLNKIVWGCRYTTHFLYSMSCFQLIDSDPVSRAVIVMKKAKSWVFKLHNVELLSKLIIWNSKFENSGVVHYCVLARF